MKRFIVIILALFMLASCAGMQRDTLDSDMEIAVDVGGSANSYDVNTTPSASADYLIGVDDFAGSWAVQRFSIAELLKLVTIITGNITVGGTIHGGIEILSDAAAPTAAQCYGSLNKSNGVQTVTLPAAVVGMSILIYSDDAEVKTIAVASGENIWLNGVDNGDNNTIQSPGAVGDFIALVCMSTGNWYTMGQSGVWIDTP